MEAFKLLFDHCADFRVLICKGCKVAVPPGQTQTHLKAHHPSISVSTRREVVEHVGTLGELAWKPSDVHIPKPALKNIANLQTFTDGLVCECWYSCRTLQGIQDHCKKAHNWANNQKRGGDARSKDLHASNRLWQDGQLCQRLFKASGWPAYFVVQARAQQDDGGDALRLGRADLEQRRQEREQAAREEGFHNGSRFLANAWIDFTGWPAHVQPFTRQELLSFIRPANGEEGAEQAETDTVEDEGLAKACKATRRLIHRAFQACRSDAIGRSALEFVNRREAGARNNEMPFYAKQKVQTIQRYSQRFIVILRYLWRSYDKKERPPYKLTGTQDMHMWILQETARSTAPDQTAKLEQCCLRLWIALLDHALPGDEYQSGLLSGLSILGIKADHHGGGWVPAHEYSQTLSAIITTSRALVVYHASRLRDAALKRDEAKAPTVFQLVKEMVRRFMTLTEFDGEPSPMNRMFHMRTYAYAKSKETMSAGRVSWDRDKLLIDKESFTLADLQSMAKGLYETVRMNLLRDVLLLDVDETGGVRPGATQLPELCLNKLVDQPAELASGWNFLKHPSNKLDAWADWLYMRVLTEPQLQERFVQGVDHTTDPPRIQWRDRAVAEYMKDIRAFKEGLFVLVHTCGGAPARGSEITTIQGENGEEGLGYRGIFADAGMISFTSTYHKGYSLSKRVKTIHRYVPKEVGEIVVYFLGLGRPFVSDLQMLHSGITRRTSFMWEPEPEDEWDNESNSSNEEEGCNETQGEELQDKSAAKEPANPDGFWGTDRVRRVMREQTLRHLGASLSTSTWRHAYPAIHRELARDGKVAETLDAVYYNREPAISSDARAKQAGHTHCTEEMVYGRALIESPFQTMSEREEFRRVSLDWHRILGFTSAWEEGHVHPSTRSKMLAEQEEEELARWAKLANTDLTAEFKRLVGQPDAAFRGKQEEALKAITERRLRVLVIMGTGGGKSMLFMLPAAVSPEGGITVVVVPLTALQSDLQDRCERLGIQCAKWNGTRPPYSAKIVLVTPESATTKAFGRFVDEKRMLRQLDRIVIDECHLLMESTEKWRPQLLQMTEMTEKGTQVVYLTATLPKALEPAFFHTAGLDARDVVVCRDRTSRTNIQYQVQNYKRDTLDETLMRLVKLKREQYPPESQIIVYCPSIKETKRLACLLGCTAYYKDVGTDEEKARMVRRFTCGDEKLVTATNALGLGLDAPNVRVVIHIRMCDLLRQYIQESGRAGRSGLQSEAIVLRACWVGSNGSVRHELGRSLEPPSREFLDSSQCRRISVDVEMDGRLDRRQCEDSEEKCDSCQQYPRGTKRTTADLDQGSMSMQQGLEQKREKERREHMASMIIEQRRLETAQRQRTEQISYELERLRSSLDLWNGACAICMACRGEVENHSWVNCPGAREAQFRALRDEVQWLESIQFGAYTRCTSCWAPQAVCTSWEEHARFQGAYQRRKGGTCQYMDVLKTSVAALLVFQRKKCMEWLAEQMSVAGLVHGSERVRLGQWLGAKVKLGQREASQMCRFLYAWQDGQVHCM
jgi:superfamily II DNA helicase RecQ